MSPQICSWAGVSQEKEQRLCSLSCFCNTQVPSFSLRDFIYYLLSKCIWVPNSQAGDSRWLATLKKTPSLKTHTAPPPHGSSNAIQSAAQWTLFPLVALRPTDKTTSSGPFRKTRRCGGHNRASGE